ncbi:MAG TPA: hypothetical protein VI612_04150 [Candidatus Nanoarchaeia archaeon]|nr:hypothetical protein [Candidatus Nanoarchaeia archaeon]
MRCNNRLSLFKSKLGQELPGWTYIVGLILGLFVLGFLIWLAVKSGKLSVQNIMRLK